MRTRKKPCGLNQRGVGFIETMVVSVLIVTAFLGFTTVLKVFDGYRLKTEVSQNMRTLEMNLIAAFSNPSNYSTSAVAALMISSPATIPLTVDHILPTGSPWIVQVGMPFCLSRSLTVVTPADFSTPTCLYLLQTEMRDFSTPPQAPVYRYAYQISANTNLVQLASLGGRPMGGSFTNADDFRSTAPTELYSSASVTGCNPGELSMSAVNRTTGATTCVKGTTRVLPPTRMAKSFSFDTTTFSLELQDEPSYFSTANCPTGFAVQTLDAASLYGGGTPVGDCVYKLAEHSDPAQPSRLIPNPAPASQSAGVGSLACPVGYVVDPAPTKTFCSVTTISSTPGTCVTSWVAVLGAPFESPPSSGQWWTPRTWVASMGAPASMAPTPGFATLNISGREATCTLTIPAQACGATWEGQAHLNVKCIISMPSRVSIL